MPQVIINNTDLTFSEDTIFITQDMVRPYQNTVTHITIPEGVTTIGNGAFNDCTSLTHLTFPNGLTTIGYRAFNGCTGLTSVTFPATARLTTIGNNAFAGCTGLTSVSFPDGLTTIGYSAFQGCTGLTSVSFPDNLTTIGNYAFSNCTGLTHLTFSDSLTTINDGTFRDCTGLTSVTFPDGLTTIGDCAFNSCTGLTSVSFPDGLTTIEDRAFKNCTGLTHLTFPDGLTTIEDRAFFNCTRLTHLTLPDNLTTIGNRTFEVCRNLQYILIPKSLEDKNLQYWQDKGIDPAQTRIITKTQLQAFARDTKVDSHTNIHEIATLFLVDQGHIQLPQARDHLNIRQRITQLSLPNLFRLPIPKQWILPGFAKYQNLTIAGEIVSEALAPLGQWAVQTANPLASWLSWHDITRIWVAKAKAPRKTCPPALQAAQIWSHQETANRHDKGYPKDDTVSPKASFATVNAKASYAMLSLLSQRPHCKPNHANPRTSCTKN